ncbi:hypothetical protein B1729_15025 [Microbacterium sp. B35-04]|uniref:hypothetical protein n=1 Tax=unclassified Microbacterium TaxID=2609290 RepID=UPI0013D3D623|nr:MULTISPECIES: hypothetical protein [unclassified Microbacterium]KAF2412470.1 hypothetical protein B1729_15025 [Microbacterium sp. B35-04]KAF2417866.1 hypothetical protein B2K11_10820 [Microbacterium sp. B35-30]
MSTTGNEYEQPGVNYPDREDAGGATETPGDDDAVRDQQTDTAPAMGEPGPDAQPARAWTESSGQETAGQTPTASGTGAASNAAGQEQSAAGQAGGAAAAGPSEGALSGEPSHEAVGIGVVDDADHHGSDAGRDTLTVSEAQRTPGALGTEQEQRLPAMAQNNASEVDKVAGIVVQTRSDVGGEPLERIAEVLRQRLTQAGVELPEHDIEELARQVSTGDADGPADSGRGPSA